MKVLITGSRKWTDREIIRKAIQVFPRDTTFIHGAATGADSIAGELAKHNGYKVIPFPVSKEEWQSHSDCRCGPTSTYCYMAAKRRNSLMLNQHPDLVLAFVSRKSTTDGAERNLSEAKGTYDTISKAFDKGIPVKMFED